MSVNIDKNAFKCWICGYSGNKIVPMWRFVNDGFFVAPAYEHDTDRVGVTFGYEFKIK